MHLSLLVSVSRECSVERKPQYDAWIDMYGGDDFEKEVKDYIGMVNKACQSASSEEFESMKKHFLMTCKVRYELGWVRF